MKILPFKLKKEILVEYFNKNNIQIAFIGDKKEPLLLDINKGETLNCKFSKDGLKIIFIFNNKSKSKYFISFYDLLKQSDFNFKHWYENSTKKRIYVFENNNQFFERYFVKNNTYIPIFTDNLDRSYFVFTMHKALIYEREMSKNGIMIKIKRKWEK